MKKFLLITAVLLGCSTVFAQNLDKNEAKQISAFLAQTSENGTTNAQVLKVANPSQLSGGVEGLTVVGGHVTAIEWKDKHLAGQLSLNNFKSLTKVDVSRNKLTSVAVVNAPALTELNASRNVLTAADMQQCPVLQKVTLYKNRLSDNELGRAPCRERVPNCV